MFCLSDGKVFIANHSLVLPMIFSYSKPLFTLAAFLTQLFFIKSLGHILQGGLSTLEASKVSLEAHS